MNIEKLAKVNFRYVQSNDLFKYKDQLNRRKIKRITKKLKLIDLEKGWKYDDKIKNTKKQNKPLNLMVVKKLQLFIHFRNFKRRHIGWIKETSLSPIILTSILRYQKMKILTNHSGGFIILNK